MRTPNDTGTPKERFERRLVRGDEDECWEWQGARNDSGYGQMHVNGRLKYTHVLAFEFEHGCVVPPDKVVRHTCDNPPCVNPKHLVEGTHKENVRDMYERGRNVNVVGERNGRSKLTADVARKIKESLHLGESYGTLAKRFNVSRSTIGAIKEGRTWQHV